MRTNATAPAWPNIFHMLLARSIADAGLAHLNGSPAMRPSSAKSIAALAGLTACYVEVLSLNRPIQGQHECLRYIDPNQPARALPLQRSGRSLPEGAGPRHSKLSEPKINQLLTKLAYLEIGHSGRVCWLSGQPLA